MNFALYSFQDIRHFGLMSLANGDSGVDPFLFITVALLLIIGSYLLGSLNFAIVISKAAYGKDIRDYGSNNAGMTNMMRTFGTKAAVMVLLGDVMKSIVSVTLSMLVCGIDVAYIAGVACIIGHCFPVFYKFRGGKGFATTAGMVLAAEPIIFLICLVIFVVIVAATKYISAGSIITALFFPLILNMLYRGAGGISTIMAVCAVFLALFILFNHRANVSRLMKGEEKKFSFKKSVPTEAEKSGEKSDDNSKDGSN